MRNVTQRRSQGARRLPEARLRAYRTIACGEAGEVAAGSLRVSEHVRLQGLHDGECMLRETHVAQAGSVDLVRSAWWGSLQAC